MRPRAVAHERAGRRGCGPERGGEGRRRCRAVRSGACCGHRHTAQHERAMADKRNVWTVPGARAGGAATSTAARASSIADRARPTCSGPGAGARKDKHIIQKADDTIGERNSYRGDSPRRPGLGPTGARDDLRRGAGGAAGAGGRARRRLPPAAGRRPGRPLSAASSRAVTSSSRARTSGRRCSSASPPRRARGLSSTPRHADGRPRAVPPPRGRPARADARRRTRDRSVPPLALTYDFNLTGQPAISTPRRLTDDGLRVGPADRRPPRRRRPCHQRRRRLGRGAGLGRRPPLDAIAL